ncbi:MAG: rhomboid family intramembrane serine protease [Pseudomonadota bacterium]
MRPARTTGPDAPFFNAPSVVVTMTLILVAAHIARQFVPEGGQYWLFYYLALVPERLALMVDGSGHPDAYGFIGLIGASLGHVLLHGDWMHLIMNTAMLLALGAPVARRLGSVGFLNIFFVSAVAGAILFFMLRPGDSPPAIGASGGVSGIMAAALLIMADPRATFPVLLSPNFLKTSAAFLIINIILALAGPAMLGSAIAWDAHVGGYIAGALAMAWLAGRQ